MSELIDAHVHLWDRTRNAQDWMDVLQRGVDSTVDLASLVITGSLVATIPMFLLMIAMHRYWRSGVTMGRLK